MAGTSPLAGLLDRAGNVFALAWELGRTFEAERGTGGGVRRVDPTSWGRHQPAFDEFCNAVLDLRDATQDPPDGFAPVAQALLKAAGVAKKIRDSMQTPDGRSFAAYLDFFPDLNSIWLAGAEAVKNVTKARQLDDPFAFVNQPATGTDPVIDTTPILPNPPADFISSAAREIPSILANVKPSHDETIELIASHLAKRLQDAGHTLAAAHWAIHDAVQAGRLRAGLVEFDMPSMWGGPGSQWSGGGRGTTAIPKGKPAPFDCFKVVATKSLWTWWHSFTRELPPPSRKPKPSTKNGDAREKLIAALTKHHKYSDGSCLEFEPIGNNALAKLAKVSNASASNFFKSQFGKERPHAKYIALCRNKSKLITFLKNLNREFTPGRLYGGAPPENGGKGRGDDERGKDGDDEGQ